MGYCDICGQEKPLNKTLLEGSILNLCDNCKRFGKTIHQESERKLFLKNKSQVKNIPDIDEASKIRDDFCSVLKREREKRNLTQKDLASKLNEKENTLHNLEIGHMTPTDELVRKLSKFFGISFYESESEESDKKTEKADSKTKSSSPEFQKNSDTVSNKQEFVLGDFIKVKKRN